MCAHGGAQGGDDRAHGDVFTSERIILYDASVALRHGVHAHVAREDEPFASRVRFARRRAKAHAQNCLLLLRKARQTDRGVDRERLSQARRARSLREIRARQGRRRRSLALRHHPQGRAFVRVLGARSFVIL